MSRHVGAKIPGPSDYGGPVPRQAFDDFRKISADSTRFLELVDPAVKQDFGCHETCGNALRTIFLIRRRSALTGCTLRLRA